MSTQGKSKKAEIALEVESFDWSRIDALSDQDIEAAVRSDPDSVLLSDAEIAEADLVIPHGARGRKKQTAA